MRQLIYNAVKCLECNETIVSRHRHDYKTCDCPNEAMVDGGLDYQRYGAKSMSRIVAIDIYADDDFEIVRRYAVRGSRGKDGLQPLSWIAICDMDDDYLKVMSGVTDFYTLGTGNTFIDRSIISGNIVAWSPINAFSNPTDNYVYILMSNIILDDFEKQKMVESLVLGLGDKITVAEEAVNTILNFWKTEFSKEKTDESKQAQDFLKSQQMAPFSNFQPERNGLLLSSKQRIMDFITDGGNPIQQQAFTDIISSSDYNNDKNIFNGKKQFL